MTLCGSHLPKEALSNYVEKPVARAVAICEDAAYTEPKPELRQATQGGPSCCQDQPFWKEGAQRNGVMVCLAGAIPVHSTSWLSSCWSWGCCNMRWSGPLFARIVYSRKLVFCLTNFLFQDASMQDPRIEITMKGLGS